MKRVLIVLVLLQAYPVLAQESASYKLTEHTFNAGGHPSDGVVLMSTSYKISLDSIGDSLTGVRLSGGSFRVDGGFVGSYPPPGEVHGLQFFVKDWLWWDLERSAGDYNVYRDGLCLWSGITDPPAPDSDIPSPDFHYSYLVTVENLIREEGTPGYHSDGIERPDNDPCP